MSEFCREFLTSMDRAKIKSALAATRDDPHYISPEEERLLEAPCPMCDGARFCIGCGGDGCDFCERTGNCPECHGSGRDIEPDPL